MTLAAVILLAAAMVTQAQQAPAQGQGAGGGAAAGRGAGGGGAAAAPPAIKQVKPGLYLVTGLGGNSTVRVTNDGIVVVDTKNLGEANYNQLIDLIKTVSNQPVKYAVITHVHQDHSGNTDSFIKNGTQVVASEELVKNLETYTAPAGKPGKPNVTFAKDYSIKLGNTEVAHVYHFGAGHTSGDSMVYFPDLKVAAFGDAFATGNMNCDYPMGGSLLEWGKSLDAALKLDFDTAIPGHGNDPGTKADVQAAQKRFAAIAAATLAEAKKGTAKEQFIANITAADASLNVGQLLQNNQARIDLYYAEAMKAAK